jgi:hypothetical protein
MKIIALKGRHDSGKTTTTNFVYQQLLNMDWQPIPGEYFSPPPAFYLCQTHQNQGTAAPQLFNLIPSLFRNCVGTTKKQKGFSCLKPLSDLLPLPTCTGEPMINPARAGR